MNRETFAKMIDISDFILFGKITENNTINKITRILNTCSDKMITYIYQIITCSFSFFKTHSNEDKKSKAS